MPTQRKLEKERGIFFTPLLDVKEGVGYVTLRKIYVEGEL